MKVTKKILLSLIPIVMGVAQGSEIYLESQINSGELKNLTAEQRAKILRMNLLADKIRSIKKKKQLGNHDDEPLMLPGTNLKIPKNIKTKEDIVKFLKKQKYTDQEIKLLLKLMDNKIRNVDNSNRPILNLGSISQTK